MLRDLRQQLKVLVFVGLSASLSTCTEIPIELKDPIIPESDKVVLIEELTGASCPNCPKGSAAIENILAKFPGKVVAVGIHGDFLAKPTAKSKYDFRNPKAKDLENWFKPWFGKPSASINRVPDETNTLMIDLPDLWQAAVEKELQKDHRINILMDVAYEASSRRVDVEIAAIPLTDLPGNYAISVYLLESGIVDAQSNGSMILEDFTHKHVLRDMLTRFDGDAFGNNLTAGSILKRNYSYTLPDTPAGLWVPGRMEVVAMISHNESNDKSVLQAVEKSVVE